GSTIIPSDIPDARRRQPSVWQFWVVRRRSLLGNLQPFICQPLINAEDLAELDRGIEVPQGKFVLIPRYGGGARAPDSQCFQHFSLKIVATIGVRHPGNVPFEGPHARESWRVREQKRESATETFQHRE